jgi:hypothetical protein
MRARRSDAKADGESPGEHAQSVRICAQQIKLIEATFSTTTPTAHFPPSLPHHIAKMSDAGEIEVEQPQGYPVLPKDVASEIGSVKLFNKWTYEDVEIRDISLT